jgi:phosphoribosylamine--glycine ligase
MLFSIARGSLTTSAVRLKENTVVCVVMASKGYPDPYESGKAVFGLESAESGGAIVFHAGTKRENNRVVTSGGRVLAVTALGPAGNLAAAIRDAYAAVNTISFEGAQFRTDIGQRGLTAARS